MDRGTSNIGEAGRKDGDLLGFSHHDDPFPLTASCADRFYLLP
jgi:hypothetical protein